MKDLGNYGLQKLMEAQGMERLLINEYNKLINEYGTAIDFVFGDYVYDRMIANYSFDSIKRRFKK